MSFYSYKQQYTFGFKEINLHDLTFATSSTKFYLGEECGAKANLSASTNDSTHTKPIDLKGDKQMFALKALLDLKVIKDAPLKTGGTCAVVTLTPTVTTAGTGTATVTLAGIEYEVALTSSESTATKVVTALKGALDPAGWTLSGTSTLIATQNSADGYTYSASDWGFAFVGTGSADVSGTWASTTSGVAPSDDTTQLDVEIWTADEDSSNADQYDSGTAHKICTIHKRFCDLVSSIEPVAQITMPKETGRFVWAVLCLPAIVSSTNPASGKILVHFDVNY